MSHDGRHMRERIHYVDRERGSARVLAEPEAIVLLTRGTRPSTALQTRKRQTETCKSSQAPGERLRRDTPKRPSTSPQKEPRSSPKTPTHANQKQRKGNPAERLPEDEAELVTHEKPLV